VRRLLQRHRDDYLYGCVAADIVVGKNMAKALYHCHNWTNGLKLLDGARGEREQALAMGFLSHLGADIVAHNYFVPFKSVVSFRSTAARHTYWEVRFDQLAHRHDGVWDVVREIGRKRFPHHDEFLQERLVNASRLLPFSTSARLFNSMMLLSGLERWRTILTHIADRSSYRFAPGEPDEWNHLAVESIADVLNHLDASRPVRAADPIGRESLKASRHVRRGLRELHAGRHFDEGRWPHAEGQLRERFRLSMYQPFGEVPDLRQLVGVRHHGSASSA
jgi:hypothetical protein